VIGGITGALLASKGTDYALSQKEIVSWLGE